MVGWLAKFNFITDKYSQPVSLLEPHLSQNVIFDARPCLLSPEKVRRKKVLQPAGELGKVAGGSWSVAVQTNDGESNGGQPGCELVC